MKLSSSLVPTVFIVVSLIAVACSDSRPATREAVGAESVAVEPTREAVGADQTEPAVVKPGRYRTKPGCVSEDPEYLCFDYLVLKSGGDAEFSTGDIISSATWAVEGQFVRVGFERVFIVEGNNLRDAEYGGLYVRQ